MSDLSPQIATGKSPTPIGCGQIPPRVVQIIRDVARDHGIEPHRILEDERTRKIATARWEAMQLVRSLELANGKPPSFTQIGRWFNRDHTSVIHACRKGVPGIQTELFLLRDGPPALPVSEKRDRLAA